MTDAKTPLPHQKAAPLERARFLAGLAIAAERLWPLILPLVLVVSLFAMAAWFGLFHMAGEPVRLALLVAFGLAALASASLLLRFRLPRRTELDARLERDNALIHTPLQVQTDALPESADPFAIALWREHRRRMAEGLGDLSPAAPRTAVPARDPFAMRTLAFLGLVVAFAFSFGPGGGRLADAFVPRPMAGALPARVDVWVTPPAYTGRPPLFLAANGQTAAAPQVPEGSLLTIRVSGGSGKETFAFLDPASLEPLAAPTPEKSAEGIQFAHTLTRAGTAQLHSGNALLGEWPFVVIADQPPKIAFSSPPKRGANGGLELNYTITDDYGAASATAEIKINDAAASRPLYEAPSIALTLPRRNGDGKARTLRDLTQHPFAGADISLVLTAIDGKGQSASSEAAATRLPERLFGNPLARALLEQRRMLALDANAKPRVLELMDAITIRPEDTIPVASHYLGVTTARARLNLARDDEALRGVVDYLWEVALAIDEGSLTDAERRLRQAEEALKNALKNDASDEEIAKLMDELRKAMDQFLKEFAERAPEAPADQGDENTTELRKNDLDRMMDQIENLAKSGNKDKAEELLSQMQDMMKNLRTARRQQGNQAQNPMREQMNKLGEIMRRQQEMMNETHRLDQMQRGQRGGRPQPGQEGQEGEGEDNPDQTGKQQGQAGRDGDGDPQSPGPNGMSPEEFADALRQLQDGQGQLEGELGQLMKELEGMGIKPGEGFGEAGKSMGKAGDALGEGEGEQAVGEQGRALEALRRGANDMMNQMQQAGQGQEGGSEQGGRQSGANRDPLGRPTATDGPDFGESVDLPDEIDVQRAREILEAIRKRLGDALSPELEKQYLERLLENR